MFIFVGIRSNYFCAKVSCLTMEDEDSFYEVLPYFSECRFLSTRKLTNFTISLKFLNFLSSSLLQVSYFGLKWTTLTFFAILMQFHKDTFRTLLLWKIFCKWSEPIVKETCSHLCIQFHYDCNCSSFRGNFFSPVRYCVIPSFPSFFLIPFCFLPGIFMDMPMKLMFIYLISGNFISYQLILGRPMDNFTCYSRHL